MFLEHHSQRMQKRCFRYDANDNIYLNLIPPLSWKILILELIMIKKTKGFIFEDKQSWKRKKKIHTFSKMWKIGINSPTSEEWHSLIHESTPEKKKKKPQ